MYWGRNHNWIVIIINRQNVLKSAIIDNVYAGVICDGTVGDTYGEMWALSRAAQEFLQIRAATHKSNCKHYQEMCCLLQTPLRLLSLHMSVPAAEDWANCGRSRTVCKLSQQKDCTMSPLRVTAVICGYKANLDLTQTLHDKIHTPHFSRHNASLSRMSIPATRQPWIILAIREERANATWLVRHISGGSVLWGIESCSSRQGSAVLMWRASKLKAGIKGLSSQASLIM